MFTKIIKAAGSTILSFFIVFNFISIGAFPAEATLMGSDINDDNSLGIVIEESSDDLTDSMTSNAPDLGDDQAFPFIPGFGKNSGKD
tara:strand:+ start:81 stop:341 length:261 start_codon:yes stop_codon:yes gene_type:complete